MPQRKLISFDWAMKRLLRSKANFEVLEGFLSELLKQNIQILEVLESEANKETLSDKFNRVDLKVKTNQDEIIIIEVQFEREFDYLQRILYGVAKVITEHMKESVSYASVIKVISVNILYFDLGHGDDYIYHGTTRFQGLHRHDELKLNLTQQALFAKQAIADIYPEYYLLKINQFDDIARDTLDEWIYFLKNEEIKDEFSAQGLKKAKEVLDILKLSEADRQAYERYSDDLRYQASMIESSYGVGRMEGRKEGKQEGRQEGKLAERRRIAVSLLDVIDDDSIMAEKTGLTLEQVKQLREEKKSGQYE